MSDLGYIRSIHFASGFNLELRPDSIVVFVGPNNAGKSQALRDIFTLIEEQQQGIVINQITVETPTYEGMISVLKTNAMRTESGDYQGLDFHVPRFSLEHYANNSLARGIAKTVLYKLMDTQARLSICNPPQTVCYNQPKTHPIQIMAFDEQAQARLSGAFQRVFGTPISPNLFAGSTIPLCIGPELKTPDGLTATETVDYFNSRFNTYLLAHKQGDGIKSFLGVLLYMMIDYYRGLFIDEPESFLHPPQATALGREIVNNSAGRQVFLATHSKELLAGLLTVGAQRVMIVRITRDEAGNSVSALDSRGVVELSATTLLRYSDVMNSLFHEQVVLCESDSDCKMYSVIADALKADGSAISESLFLPTGGKQRAKQYVQLLRRLGIKTKVVVDIDLLDNKATLKGLIEECGGAWEGIKDDYGEFCKGLDDEKMTISIDYLKGKLIEILERSEDGYVSDEQLEAMRPLLRRNSKWSQLKKNGKNCLRGEQLERFNRIDEYLRQFGVVLVPVGELECFIREIDGLHGPEWVNGALERYPDLSDAVYDEIKGFVACWI